LRKEKNMDAVSVSGGDEKVYRFDEKEYKKNNRRSVVLSLFYQLFVTAMYAFLIFSLYSNLGLKPEYLLFLIALAMPITRIIWTLRKYLWAKKMFKNDFVSIKINNGDIKCVQVYFRNEHCDIYYRIRSVDEVTRKKYIDVNGNIEKDYVYDKDISIKDEKRLYRNGQIDGTEQSENLRIPSYFENMDEIYEVLEKMKGLE
jgi:hypothetical protein